MLKWAVVSFVLAITAALLGFTEISGTAASIAQLLFVVFFVIFVITMVYRAFHITSPRYHAEMRHSSGGVGNSRHRNR